MIGAFEEARAASDPLACFDLDTLIEGAARLRPEQAALADASETLTFGETDRRVGALAAAFQHLGLQPGETILLAAAAPATSFVALAGALRAGLRVALAPAWTEASQASRMALLSGAAALVIAPCGDFLASGDDWLAAAASAPSTRLVCSLGGEIDGAVRLQSQRIPAPDGRDSLVGRPPPPIVTFEAGAVPIIHSQRTLVAAALDVVSRARIGMRLPLISTISPTSFAGLVAGPIASLIAGASLSWRIPFETRSFLSALDDSAPAHLIAPAALAPMLEQAALTSAASLSSLLLLNRLRAWDAFHPKPALWKHAAAARAAIVDLYAYGERAIVPEPRGADGSPTQPASEPHYLDLDGVRILALDWSTGVDRRLEGAAVSKV